MNKSSYVCFVFKRDRTHLYRFDVMLSTNNFKCVLTRFIRNHLILIHSLIQKHKRKSGEILRFPVCYWVTRSTYKPRELSSKCHSVYFIVCVYRVMLITSVISRVAPRFINPLSNPNIPIKTSNMVEMTGIEPVSNKPIKLPNYDNWMFTIYLL